jgi:hypothetical protein
VVHYGRRGSDHEMRGDVGWHVLRDGESCAWSWKLRRAYRSSELPPHQSSARKPPDLPDAAPATS